MDNNEAISDAVEALPKCVHHRRTKASRPRYHRRSNRFARQIASMEFGHYRYHSWRNCRDFIDRTPAEIARLREKVGDG